MTWHQFISNDKVWCISLRPLCPSAIQAHYTACVWTYHISAGSILSVESNQNVESKTKNVESKTEKCGVQNSIYTSRNQLC